MKTYILDIENENIIDKVLWMLNHFKDDGIIIREASSDTNINIESSIKQAVNEINMVKANELQAKPVEDLLNAL